VKLEIPRADLAGAVEERLAQWASDDLVRRLWAKDPSLWAPQGEPWPPELADRLGWLDLPESARAQAPELAELAETVRGEGYERVVLLGMGGSSLAPEVFQAVLGGGVGFPGLLLLDSTHPDAVRAVEAEIDPARTLFVVASKSGTTIETISLFRYFWSRVTEVVREPGRSFVAVTDPGTPLAELAGERGFRRVVLAPPDMGGRGGGGGGPPPATAPSPSGEGRSLRLPLPTSLERFTRGSLSDRIPELSNSMSPPAKPGASSQGG